MTNIQIKALQHVVDVLKSVDRYPVYHALTDALESAGIEQSTRSTILSKFQEAMTAQMKKVSDAERWVDTLISDTNTKS